VSEPRRWREDGGASPEVRDLLAAARAPGGMSPADRARATRHAARLAAAPAGWFAWSGAAKALAASLATAALVATARVVTPASPAPPAAPRTAPPARPSARPAAPSPGPVAAPAPLPGAAAPPTVWVAPTVLRVESPRTPTTPRTRRAPPPGAGALAPTPAPPGATPPAAMAPPRDESLAAEAALLAQAQRSLERDPAASLDLLEAHAGFARPRLAEERELLAVLALQRLGRGEAMRARGEAMLARWPSGAAAQRVRRLLGPTSPP